MPEEPDKTSIVSLVLVSKLIFQAISVALIIVGSFDRTFHRIVYTTLCPVLQQPPCLVWRAFFHADSRGSFSKKVTPLLHDFKDIMTHDLLLVGRTRCRLKLCGPIDRVSHCPSGEGQGEILGGHWRKKSINAYQRNDFCDQSINSLSPFLLKRISIISIPRNHVGKTLPFFWPMFLSLGFGHVVQVRVLISSVTKVWRRKKSSHKKSSHLKRVATPIKFIFSWFFLIFLGLDILFKYQVRDGCTNNPDGAINSIWCHHGDWAVSYSWWEWFLTFNHNEGPSKVSHPLPLVNHSHAPTWVTCPSSRSTTRTRLVLAFLAFGSKQDEAHEPECSYTSESQHVKQCS